jgi:hypothetical protein
MACKNIYTNECWDCEICTQDTPEGTKEIPGRTRISNAQLKELLDSAVGALFGVACMTAKPLSEKKTVRKKKA